jgi:hypothetical protein
MEIDTGELEVAGLPAVNLGTAIGYGANITSIVCSYDIKGIRTVYKCATYTSELGRYQRYYQELVDKMRRDAQRRNNTHYPQANYWAMNKELSGLKKAITSIGGEGIGGAGGDTNFVAKVISRESSGPFYLCQIYKQQVVNGWVTQAPAMAGGVKVTNLSEHTDAPARVPLGSFVRIRPARQIKLTNSVGQAIATISAWVMEEPPPTPENLTATIVSSAGSTARGPTYRIEVREGSFEALADGERAKLAAPVVNIGETPGSAGNLAVGTEVSVAWVLGDDQRYSPVIEHHPDIFKREEAAP